MNESKSFTTVRGPLGIKETATIHQAPTFYVEHRGWSQEVNTTHYELESDPVKRFQATGKRTPLDPHDTPPLITFGATAQEAIDNFTKALLVAPWHDYFCGIMTRIERLEAQVEAAEKATALREPTTPPASP